MKVDGKHYRSIWFDNHCGSVKIIDQRWLPHKFSVVELTNDENFCDAIHQMWVRGAPLIGATAAYGVAVEMQKDASDISLENICRKLQKTRPTAINLAWALTHMREFLTPLPVDQRAHLAMQRVHQICEEDVETNRQIGVHGVEIIRQILQKKNATGNNKQPVKILTHCNAGWLATVDWGTATSPIYHAVEAKIPVHIWVDETRPRNQGAQLTAWEMDAHGISHQLIVDNAGGHLMQHAQVDMVIVGTDRTTANGDVCNKIGTYLKALAAKDNNIPFYVALPSTTIDWNLKNGIAEIPIEERDGKEVTNVWGKLEDGTLADVQICPDGSPAGNPAFDVTPARLVTGLITERGISAATPESLAKMFPEFG